MHFVRRFNLKKVERNTKVLNGIAGFLGLGNRYPDLVLRTGPDYYKEPIEDTPTITVGAVLPENTHLKTISKY